GPARARPGRLPRQPDQPYRSRPHRTAARPPGGRRRSRAPPPSAPGRRPRNSRGLRRDHAQDPHPRRSGGFAPVSNSSFLKPPKSVWAVAFACVIAFMGIGLVDPILKPIADELGASPSQVSLLFTSYMAVMGVAMLVTGAVSSRIGAKRTLIAGLTLIIVF